MLLQPVAETGEDRGGTLQPCASAVGGFSAANVGLYDVEVHDKGHTFPGQQRGADPVRRDQTVVFCMAITR